MDEIHNCSSIDKPMDEFKDEDKGFFKVFEK